MDWKAEYSALSSTRSQKKKLKQILSCITCTFTQVVLTTLNQKLPSLCLLDLSAAFHTTDHGNHPRFVLVWNSWLCLKLV